MLILVPIKKEQVQDYISHTICYESFQIHLLLIRYNFEGINYDSHLDF